jgi:hypothetical protein
MSRESFEAEVGAQVDILEDRVRKAATVLDAMIVSDVDALNTVELRCLASVAQDYLEQALDILDPGRHSEKGDDDARAS